MGCSPVITCLHAFVERGIDVLDKDKAPFWGIREQMVELIICKPSLG
jgi:hypothetical protein